MRSSVILLVALLRSSCRAQGMNRPTISPTAKPTEAPSAQPARANGKQNQQPQQQKNNQNQEYERVGSEEYVGGPFCRESGNTNEKEMETCRRKDQEWSTLLSENDDITFHRRDLTGICGPDCRPSCVTLLLDLDKLDYEEDLVCKADELCQCEFKKSRECQAVELEGLFDMYPKCYLEEADCLGPTVYDDTVHFTQRLGVLAGLELPPMDRCTSIPDGELYCRFQDWKMIHPLTEYTCTDEDCVNPESKIYFEYCNIVYEDPTCDNDCDGNKKCGKKCKKIVEPFPPGWTTFVVSAPIAFPRSLDTECSKTLQYQDQTGQACFLERVEMYYPELDEECSKGCPHCHNCPLLELGDTFGPLEVVGFGHRLDPDNNNKDHEQECAACDKQSNVECSPERELDCEDLFSCHRAVDCETGSSLGLPPFQDECTFQGAATSMAAQDEPTDELTSTSVPVEDDKDVDNDRPTFAGAATQVQSTPSNTDPEMATIFGVSLGAIALIVATVLLRRKVRGARNTKTAVAALRSSSGNTAIAEPCRLDLEGVKSNNEDENDGDYIGDDSGSNDSGGAASHDTPNTAMAQNGFRTYRGASILETEGDDDVEAIHMVGISKLH